MSPGLNTAIEIVLGIYAASIGVGVGFLAVLVTHRIKRTIALGREARKAKSLREQAIALHELAPCRETWVVPAEFRDAQLQNAEWQ